MKVIYYIMFMKIIGFFVLIFFYGFFLIFYIVFWGDFSEFEYNKVKLNFLF